MNTIANINNTFAIATANSSVITNAIIAAEKFYDKKQDAFMNERITFECSRKLDIFFSIEFLKAIKVGDESSCISLAPRFEEECNDIDLACNMYWDQIERNTTLTDALIKYVAALNSMKNLYFNN
nr:MAG TPA: hypothetical protein [Caudoviricetes sp.]